jgi:hypothetical protein
MTQEVADCLSAGIAAHPEDWHMLQRVFEADLDARGPVDRTIGRPAGRPIGKTG